MERKRHMVEIADDSWEKLERLAGRLDAAQFVYKGRPRYGKLIELAIEKLEDSTMEWTVEEVWVDGGGKDITEEMEDILFGEPLPVDQHYTKATEEWWLANPNIAPIKTSSFSFQAKPPTIDPDLLKETTEAVAAAMAVQLEKQAEKAFISGDTQKLAASFKEYEQDAHGFFEPNPATIHEADVWTYPPNTNFTSVGTALKLHARTDKEWTDEQLTQVQDAVSYAIFGAAWLIKPFHISYVGGVGFCEYMAMIEMHNSGVMEFVIERAKSSLKHALIKLGLSGTKQHPSLDKIKAEYEAKKSNKPSKLKIYTHGLSHGVSSVSVEVELTQALSAPQQIGLRLHALSVALEYVVNKLELGDKSIDCVMHNIPWNKLKIEIVFPFDVALKGDLQTIGNAVGSAIEKWLLQGNFIGTGVGLDQKLAYHKPI